MRREWSGWIKNRQWSEFERLAKTEPSQALADVVAELERGFPDKADRRALRKILFLLSQNGIRPQPIEVETEEGAPAAPFEFGFLTSADAYGDAVVTYARQEGRNVRWLVAHLNARSGITDAAETDFNLEDSKTRVQRMSSSPPKPLVGASIPSDLALGMIAQAASITRSPMPPVVAYWRSRLKGVEMPEHPGEGLPRSEASEDDRRQIPMTMEPTLFWRLELGAAAPLLVDMYEIELEASLSEEEKEAKMQAALLEARRRAFTSEVLRDHERRILDLAYVAHLNGMEESGLLMNALDDLRARGAESDYAVGLMNKAIVMLTETLRQNREAPQEAPR